MHTNSNVIVHKNVFGDFIVNVHLNGLRKSRKKQEISSHKLK